MYYYANRFLIYKTMFDLQPNLENNLIKITPLKADDFEILYAVASDPLIWEQHPNKDRYKREVFETFFKGAMESKGAFLVYNKINNELIGSSRFYELNEAEKSIKIGYTFLSRSVWAKGYNKALKKLMIDYAFNFVDNIILHIGATNFRSQKAAEKIGAIKIEEIEVEYFGESAKWNFVYQISKSIWLKA